jgi:hypothetical protein
VGIMQLLDGEVQRRDLTTRKTVGATDVLTAAGAEIAFVPTRCSGRCVRAVIVSVPLANATPPAERQTPDDTRDVTCPCRSIPATRDQGWGGSTAPPYRPLFRV